VLLPDENQLRQIFTAFVEALKTLGWTDGRNVRFEERWVPGADTERIRRGAADLVRVSPDVILTESWPFVAALKAATTSIPIVFASGVNDPVANGFVASLAHPGGNITGFTLFDRTIGSKFLQLLKDAAPHVTRVLWIWNPASNPPVPQSLHALAAFNALELSIATVHNDSDLESSVAAFARKPGGALAVPPANFNVEHRAAIVRLANRYRLPSIGAGPAWPRSGGFMSYGTDIAGIFRQSAGYVDRILRGEKPGDLPVQNPTKLVFAINLKTAKALGLTIPASLLVQADEVIR